MRFSEIPGLEDLKQTLINSVKNNHIAHAQLFAGIEGSAALAMALALATFVNCEDKEENDSCGKCPSCIKYNKLIHPDLHFVFPYTTTKTVTSNASCSSFMKEWRTFVLENPYAGLLDWGSHIGAENKLLNISAEEGRNIIKTLALKSFEATYKVLVIWMAEQMNTTSANAILKILEEPPEKTIFFLITTSTDKLLATILSRTQIFRVRPFSDNEIKNYLQTKINAEPYKAEQAAYLADGSINDALRLYHEVEEDNHELFTNWMRSCYKKDIKEIMDLTENFQKLGRESQKSFFQYGLNLLREILICINAGEDMPRLRESEKGFVKNISKVLDNTKVEKISAEFNKAYYHVERNINPKILFLDTSLTVSTIFHSNN